MQAQSNTRPQLTAPRFVTKFTKLIAAKRVFVIYVSLDLHHHISTKDHSKTMYEGQLVDVFDQGISTGGSRVTRVQLT